MTNNVFYDSNSREYTPPDFSEKESPIIAAGFNGDPGRARHLRRGIDFLDFLTLYATGARRSYHQKRNRRQLRERQRARGEL